MTDQKHLIDPRFHISARRSLELDESYLQIRTTLFAMEVKIKTSLRARQRRALLVGMYRQLKPWIGWVIESRLWHDEHFRLHFSDHPDRPAFIPRGYRVHSQRGWTGYQIRMLRLEFGLTQGQLAHLAGVNRTHLSEIERGFFKTRSTTLARLETALRVYASQRQSNGQKPTNQNLADEPEFVPANWSARQYQRMANTRRNGNLERIKRETEIL